MSKKCKTNTGQIVGMIMVKLQVRVIVVGDNDAPMEWLDDQFYYVNSCKPNTKRRGGKGYTLRTYNLDQAKHLIKLHNAYRKKNRLSKRHVRIMFIN